MCLPMLLQNQRPLRSHSKHFQWCGIHVHCWLFWLIWENDFLSNPCFWKLQMLSIWKLSNLTCFKKVPQKMMENWPSFAACSDHHTRESQNNWAHKLHACCGYFCRLAFPNKFAFMVWKFFLFKFHFELFHNENLCLLQHSIWTPQMLTISTAKYWNLACEFLAQLHTKNCWNQWKNNLQLAFYFFQNDPLFKWWNARVFFFHCQTWNVSSEITWWNNSDNVKWHKTLDKSLTQETQSFSILVALTLLHGFHIN